MKILIIKLGALGDVIVSTPIIKQIQEHHFDKEIWLLTSPEYKKLFINWNGISIKEIDRKSVSDMIKTIIWTRKNKFSILYDLQSNDRTSIISALSGASLRAGNHPRFPYNINPGSPYRGQCHAFERLNKIIEKAGISPAEAKPHLPNNKNIKKKIDGWIAQKKLTNKKFAIIHAGSSKQHKQKRWAYFNKLAKSLCKRNLNIVWVGSDDDSEINKELSKSFGVDATNQFSVLELIELGKYALFAVTNDSAPMHILSCSGIPIYALFGPTNPTRTHALGQSNRVISASNNFPLDDDQFKPSDISKITLSNVLNVIKKDNLIE